MNLNDFIFLICKRPVAINNGQHDITDWDNISTFLTSDYKAIVREETNATNQSTSSKSIHQERFK